MTDLRTRIAKSFLDFLSKYCFRESSYLVDEKFFGNAILTMRSSDIALRFVTDRNELFIDVAPISEFEGWVSLDLALELLGHPWGALAGITDDEVSKILTSEYERMAKLLRPENLKETRRRIDELRALPRPRAH